jgi:hypothetical protein
MGSMKAVSAAPSSDDGDGKVLSPAADVGVAVCAETECERLLEVGEELSLLLRVNTAALARLSEAGGVAEESRRWWDVVETDVAARDELKLSVSEGCRRRCPLLREREVLSLP